MLIYRNIRPSAVQLSAANALRRVGNEIKISESHKLFLACKTLTSHFLKHILYFGIYACAHSVTVVHCSPTQHHVAGCYICDCADAPAVCRLRRIPRVSSTCICQHSSNLHSHISQLVQLVFVQFSVFSVTSFYEVADENSELNG